MRLLPAAALAGSMMLTSALSKAADDVNWRSSAPLWKPIETKPDKETAGADPKPAAGDTPAASLDLPQKPRTETSASPDERVGTYLPPTAEAEEPARFPQSLDPREPIVREQPPTTSRTVAHSKSVEPLDVMPRQLIEVEQFPADAKVISSLDRNLPPNGTSMHVPIYPPADDQDEAPASLEKPKKFGHRVKDALHKLDDFDGHRFFHGQLFEAVGVAKPTLQWRDELLLWRMNNDRVPVLGTTGTPASGGIIGEPGTRSLFGPGPIDLQDRVGERSRARLLFPDRNWGIDGSFMFLGPRSSIFSFTSNNFPVISRPVYVLNPPPGEFVETVAFPGFSVGTLTIQANTKFWASDVNLFKRLCDDDDTLFDVFVGYRYQYFAEGLRITENIIAQAGAPDPIGTYTVVTDRFGTRNIFNGAQIGAQLEQRFDRLIFDLRAGVAFGMNNQAVDIEGSQVRLRPGQFPEVFNGGLLAGTSNIGRFVRNRFSIVPDVSLNVGYRITPTLRAFAGYSFMYWSNVVRPGGQIDRAVDLNNIPNTPPAPPSGQRRPGVLFGESDLFLHGVNLGVEWLW